MTAVASAAAVAVMGSDDPDYHAAYRRLFTFFVAYLACVFGLVAGASLWIFVHTGPPPRSIWDVEETILVPGTFAVAWAILVWWLDRYVVIRGVTVRAEGVEFGTKAGSIRVSWVDFRPRVRREPRWVGAWVVFRRKPQRRWGLSVQALRVTPRMAAAILARPEGARFMDPADRRVRG